MASERKRAAKADLRPVIDVGPVTEDQQLTQTDGGVIGAWVGSLGRFFTTALELETGAKASLATARALTLPATPDADEALQRFIKGTTADRKAVEAHWEITSVIHRFHRRLTARRDVAAKALEEANAIGNRLHMQYVDTEKARIAAEERRQREAAEFQARQEREAELARLEEEALQAEERSPELSDRERQFVALYCGPNSLYAGRGQACAVACSYKDALKTAARLLSNPKIQAAIKVAQEAAALRAQAAARAAAPVEVEAPRVASNLVRAAGAFDREQWTGEILDQAAFVEAFRSGQYGIPGDVLQINPAKLNEYARSLHEKLDRWPGVRAKRKTSVI